jgi:hypothetical protein
MPNFLEQLVAEWYEYQGYFVRRNIKVAKRAKGGHEGELDVVAFHPKERHLVHIEPSMDSDSWPQREKRYEKKFALGLKHIPEIFRGFEPLPKIESIALLVYASNTKHPTLSNGKVMLIGELMEQIREKIGPLSVAKNAIPEQYVILRSLQFAANYWKPNSGK